MKKRLVIRDSKVFYLLIALFLSGCSPWVRAEQAERSGFLSMGPGESLGQTFVANYDGLTGVAVYLRPESPGQGNILARLSKSPFDPQALAVSELPLERVADSGYYRLQFPPLRGSAGQDYFLQFGLDGQGGVAAAYAPGSAYLNGAAYQNGSPQDAQLSFRLLYDPRLAVLGLAKEALFWLGLVAAAAFLFILPGWALLRLFYPGWGCLQGAEKLALSGGVSLALIPLLFLWTGLLGLRLGPLYAWGPPLVSLAVLVWKKTTDGGRQSMDDRRLSSIVHRLSSSVLRPPFFSLHPASIALVLVLLLVIAVRFWVVRGLDAPLYGDSYQHSLIAQLLVDHGGLFDSWLPYADLSTFTYHFGFHTAVAAYHWITRLSIPQATLWSGQILNALAALSLYPLASRIGRSPWAGVIAVLTAGLLSPMPMFYANWGRFTQLAGQVILAPAVFILWDLLESNRSLRGTQNGWRGFLLPWLVLGGLALTHYRVLIFAVLFFAAYFLVSLTAGNLRALIGKIFWVGAGAGILFLPWFIHVFAGRILRIYAVQVATPAGQAAAEPQQASALADLFVYLPAWIWLLLPLAVGWGLWRREKGAALVSLWWFINLVAANPQWLGLPGAGSIDTFAVMIAAYFPASILIGASAGWLIQHFDREMTQPGYAGSRPGGRVLVPKWGRPAAAVILFLLVMWAGFLGARERSRDLHPAEFALVTRPDTHAADWIRENTPSQARFLVNAFFAFNDTTVVGSDAGWWLPLLAGRQTTLPPINYAYETDPQVDTLPLINALTTKIQEQGLQDPEVLDWLRQLQVTHIYIGQQQGRVNYTGPYVLDPQQLLKSDRFRPVYHQDRVWIFEILP